MTLAGIFRLTLSMIFIGSRENFLHKSDRDALRGVFLFFESTRMLPRESCGGNNIKEYLNPKVYF